MADSRPDRSLSERLFPPIAVLVLTVVVGLLWVVSNRMERLEEKLQSAEQQAAGLENKLEDAGRRNQEYALKLDRALEQVHEAQQRAESAREQASEAREYAARAELETGKLADAKRGAEAEAERVRREAEAAREATAQAQQELDSMRARREAELNRMQEALDKIAPTRRTPSGMVMQLADDSFHFDFDKTTLRPENREVLSRIAGVLLASEGYRLFVDGHTDDVGTEEYNQGLSERRAKSVRDYLVNVGIPADLITMQGFGKTNPVTSEKTRAAREKNRRVEIGIVDTIIQYREKVGFATGPRTLGRIDGSQE